MKNEKVSSTIRIIDSLGLSYNERVMIAKQLFKKDGKDYLHNYGFREIIVTELLNLHKIGGLHGKDTVEYELKSAKINRKKDETIHITKNTNLGEFGRGDKDNVNDDQDIVCSLFDNDECCIISFVIKNNENFKFFKGGKKLLKREQLEDYNNVRDSISIKYGDLINFNFEVHIWNNEEKNITIDPLI